MTRQRDNRSDWGTMTAQERRDDLCTRRALFTRRDVTLDLPWPPSLNRYWRNVGKGKTLISEDGRKYRGAVALAVKPQQRHLFADGPICVHIEAHPPDKRRRDLDNMLKAVLDALAKTEVFGDDSQIDDLHIVRRAQVEFGLLVVRIERP